MVLKRVQNTCNTYYEALPTGAVKGILKSAAFSFVISTLFRNPQFIAEKMKNQLYTAGVAVTAGIIHTLLAPIFKYMFGESQHDYHYELIKFGVVVGIVNGIAHSFSYDAFDQGRKIVLQSAIFLSAFNIPRTIARIFNLRITFQNYPIPYLQVSESPVYLVV